MKIAVDFNGDLNLIPQFSEIDSVESILVKLSEDTTSSCATLLQDMDLSSLKKAVEIAHAHGIKVKYITDATCRSNQEYTKPYNDKLFQNIKDVVTLGIDGLIISSPFMIGYAKENWPGLEVTVSRFGTVDCVERAKYWAERGADRIVLSEMLERDFDTIKKIRDAVDCKLEITANSGCLYSCPDERFHGLFTSHNTDITNKNPKLPFDYYSINCSLMKMKDMAELIKARWIRPEDIVVYEQSGIDTLKITGGQRDSSWLLNAVKAYHNKKYEGNLIDLINISGFRGELKDSSQDKQMKKEISNLGELNQDVVQLVESQKDVKVFIDNSKLNGFIDHFRSFNCSKVNCGVDCCYCHKKGQEVMSYNQDEVNESINTLSQVADKIYDRSIFARNNK